MNNNLTGINIKTPNFKDLEPENKRGILLPDQCKDIFNKAIDNQPTIIKDKFFHINPSHLYFYFYNSESIRDYGWGSAYRSLQTLLAYKLSLNNQYEESKISFKNIFLTYCRRETLIQKYKELKGLSQEPAFFKDLVFAPSETENGWIEPFISEIICKDFGIEGELFLVNDYPRNHYAPNEIFKAPIQFSEFKSKLIDHFKVPNALPVIIDDGQCSLNIIGIGECNDGNVCIFYVDPHLEKEQDPTKRIYGLKISQEGEGLKKKKEYEIRTQFFLNYKYNHWMVFMPKNENE